MSINNINLFLNKFKKLKPTNKFIKINTIDVLKDIIDIEIKERDIKIQKNILYINTHPTIKSEINIKKENILNNLNKKLSPITIKNIL